MNDEVKHKSWFKRNWMWVVTTGGCLSLIVLVILGVGSIFYGVNKVMTNYEPYQYAMEMTRNSSEVVIAIGDGIDKNGIINGKVSIHNSTGEANLEIPIEGSKGKATIFVVAHKIGEEWIYEELYVLIKDTQEEIDLRNRSLDAF